MRKLTGLLLLMYLFPGYVATAQTCLYNNLSAHYTFKVISVKDTADDIGASARKVSLLIFKNNKVKQQINFDAEYLFEDVFKSDTASRSYLTGRNKNAEVPDYDFGDLIIADLNFDGKEDIAIKHDSGGNGGPIYNFYLEDINGRFKLDRYLTEYLGSFPAEINIKRKILRTQIHANVHQEGTKSFQYNPKTKKWKLVKWEMVDF
jgi:hypothetical protein